MPDEKVEKLNIIRLTVSSLCSCSFKVLSESKSVGNPSAVLCSDVIDGGRGHVGDVDFVSFHEFAEFSVAGFIPPCHLFVQPSSSRHIVDMK